MPATCSTEWQRGGGGLAGAKSTSRARASPAARGTGNGTRPVLPPTYPPLPSASSPAQLLFGLFSGEARLPSALPSASPRRSSSSVSSPARRDSPPPSLRPPLGAALPASPASRSSPPPSQELPRQAQEGQEAEGTSLGWQR
ncbi:hypothetical protein PVAP13_9KG195300 [Panicum virgatum]|uniref:Uncharacterized protein n=1 Tax=Panicum virgatum TaxID=38727 RepID=A0A8T0NH97_PANVG|nr:hypothetical protein PVAP13_9KG195300 [Panicum virgatum]